MPEKEYIEREAIEKAFAEEIRTNYLDDYAKGFQAALLAVMSIPTADVSPVRHGRWETISDSDLSRTVICSVCNNTFYYSKRREQLKIDMMPYCPHCGAKMDEKERDENA